MKTSIILCLLIIINFFTMLIIAGIYSDNGVINTGTWLYTYCGISVCGMPTAMIILLFGVLIDYNKKTNRKKLKK